MDPAETQRGVSVRIWFALLASVGLYALLLVNLRSRSAPPPNSAGPRTASYFWMLLVLGAFEFAFLWWVARRKLRAGLGTAFGRARSFFLLRGVGAEVLMLDGMMLGIMRRPIQEPLVFFAAALGGFALCFPSREAWAEAVQIAENPGP